MSNQPLSVLDDPRAVRVLMRLYAESDRQMPSIALHSLSKLPQLLLNRALHFDEAQLRGFYADKYLALEREQAAFCYLTARARRATRIVEFGTSLGISTIWLAAAVRQNGGGRVIGTELVPEKAARARAHLEEAGLADLVEIRVGDAMETLRDVPDDIDFLLNDGFPMRALDVLKLITPRLREGAAVLTDNVGIAKANYRDYLAYIRDPRNGFRSICVPFKFGTEYSVRISAPQA